MVCWQSLVLICATLGQTGPTEAVLLDFTSARCGPCQAMLPVVARLEQNGYRVEKIDIDQRPELARQFRVDGVPCFVLMANGQEVDRTIGATSYQQLEGMFRKAARPLSGGPAVRGQSPDAPSPNFAAERPQADMSGSPGGSPTQEIAPAAMRAAERRSLAATVRLKVDDPAGNSYGTGTIIDQHGEHALVLTCGHIFRDSSGKGTITVDLFHGGEPTSVPGHLIDYDLARDVALVAMRPGVAVESAAIAGEGFHAVKGAAVFSIGCDRGAEPSVRRSRLTSINRYQGKPNLEAAGAPVEGRSGGGLFTADGMLIGVCNFADEEANEGIYAAPGAFQAHLDQAGLAAVYKTPRQQEPSSELAAVVPPADDPRPAARPVAGAARSGGDAVVAPAGFDYMASDEPPARSPRLAAHDSGRGMRGVAAGRSIELPANAAEAEVVCIVRTPTGQQRVMVLPQASPSLLEQLQREEAAGAADALARQADQRGAPVIRAQSGDW